MRLPSSALFGGSDENVLRVWKGRCGSTGTTRGECKRGDGHGRGRDHVDVHGGFVGCASAAEGSACTFLERYDGVEGWLARRNGRVEGERGEICL